MFRAGWVYRIRERGSRIKIRDQVSGIRFQDWGVI